jgi:VanZ family protein
MSSSRRGVGYWIAVWWPVAFMLAVIALESTSTFGADRTSGPLRALYQALFGHVGDARWEVIHHYIRKTGHFVGYGLVGLSWLRAWRKTRPNHSSLNHAVLAMIATALVASADEFHQSFLPNRTSSPWDVLIDCSGALTMMLLAYAVTFMRPDQGAKAA